MQWKAVNFLIRKLINLIPAISTRLDQKWLKSGKHTAQPLSKVEARAPNAQLLPCEAGQCISDRPYYKGSTDHLLATLIKIIESGGCCKFRGQSGH